MIESVLSADTSVSLLGRLRVGLDELAWDEFVCRYTKLISVWCREWGLQHSDVDDVTQMVLMKLIRRMRTFEYNHRASFRGWLRAVVRSSVKDWYADQARVPATSDANVSRILNSLEARSDLAGRLNAQFDLEMFEIALKRVRRRIHPVTWQAFAGTALEGRPAADVAATLDLKVAHVFVYRSRVREMLARELGRMTADDARSTA